MTFFGTARTFFDGHRHDPATSARQPHAGPQETEDHGGQ